ncbi:uncharacterized protein [Watersipora subatra]|uniref:uncharacterized protein n=1 Tax=Watersipora subatra TaxID=2589382 RepID=UPI00355C3FF1
MPNFGMDLGMNTGPAFASPGAPGRPQHPSNNEKRKIGKSSDKKGSVKNAPQQLAAAPTALATPPAQKSKAGIPPPPSHGTRNMATLPSMKLNSISGAESPNLIKSQPLPKIGSGKPSQQKSTEQEELSDVEMVLYGHITPDLPEAPGRLVRVFLSSTFSDMKAERNEIWTTVYPALRKHCLAHGLDFSFVDMRWGVLDYATDHHKTEEVVLAEVKRTIKVSAATSFLSIIGHRYGSIVNESTTPCEKFKILIDTANSHKLENKELLQQWYKRDDNSIPPVHVLQPISSLLPDYNSSDADKKAAASSEWQRLNDLLWQVKHKATALAVEAKKLDQQHLENMEKSVTTTEIETGILGNSQGSGRTYAIYRKLEGIEDDVEIASTAKFIDVQTVDGRTVVDKGQLEKINKFIGEPIAKLLSADSRKMYTVPWHTGGIPTDVDKQTESDRAFLSQLSNDLIEYLTRATDSHLSSLNAQPTHYKVPVKQNSLSSQQTGKKHVCTQECAMKCAMASNKAILQEYKSMESMGRQDLPANDYKEILHHLRMADIKTKLFCGRKNQLAQVKKYLENVDMSCPLMVYGAGGGGKTPFAGEVAKRVHKWLGANAVLAVRFLGSSQACEQATSALRSVIMQLSCAYQIEYRASDSASLKRLASDLKHLLTIVSSICQPQSKPCVIILDGLEHLRAVNNTHSLSWIPAILPPHVYFICSFNPDEHNLLETAKSKFTKFLELPSMTVDDMMSYIDKTLEYHSRTLTTQQRQVLLERLTAYPYPVYAQMLANLAVETTSDMTVNYDLSQTVEDAVTLFLLRLEKRYGEKFVAHALSFITCGHSGISEVELEDALSCSDEVLVEVYVYHEPPVKGVVRIPSHLWPMLRKELDLFIVEKATNDYTLISWYHNSVEKVVKKRYMDSPELFAKYNNLLCEIYLSRNGVHRTITLSKLRQPITIENADRQVAAFSNTEMLPLRVLYSIVHHLIGCGDTSKLKSMTVCNLDYIIAVWKKVDLRAMANITNNILEELKEKDCSEDVELKALAVFYESRLSEEPTFSLQGVTLGRTEYSPKALKEFLIILVGAFSHASDTPCINTLIEKARSQLSQLEDPLIIPSESCILFGQDKLKWQLTDCDGVISDTEDVHSLIALVNKSRKTLETIDINDAQQYSLTSKAKISSVKLSQKRVFALTDETVIVQSYTREESPQVTFKTDNFSKNDFLNRCIAVSRSARLVCVGGKDRLGVYEDKSPTGDNPSYKGKSSLSLGGVKSTEAVLFTTDEKYTISAHTIAAKNRSVGGLVKWDYETKVTEARLSLPSPILKNCLHLLSDKDEAICACDHNDILVVSFREQRIIEKLNHGKNSWVDMSIDDGCLALVFDNSEVKFWTLSTKKSVLITSCPGARVASLCSSQSQAFVGTDQGSVAVYDMQDGHLLKKLHVSFSSITKIKIVSEQYLLAFDTATDVFVLSLEKLLKEQESAADTKNSLGGSFRGIFSSSGDSLLVERSMDGTATLYSTSDLTSIDISASKGYHKLSPCADNSYLVGQKKESLKVWDYGKGQEILPPPDIKEQCDTLLEPFHACLNDPTIVIANDGRLTQWRLKDSHLTTSSYIGGSSIEKITSSSTLLAFYQRSGSYDNWVVQVVDRDSGRTLLTTEREDAIQDIVCLKQTCLYLSNGTCILSDTTTSSSKELKFSSTVQHISSSSQDYLIVEGDKTLTLVDGVSGDTLHSVKIGEKILGIVYSTDGYALISLNFSRIQLVSWGKSSSPKLSNIIPITCGHLSAHVDMTKKVLFVYGRLLDESRLLTFEMHNL